LLIDYQDTYTNDANVHRLFPSLRNNVETLLVDARSRFPPENIVHIRSNYNLVFARNFKILHPDKPLPVDIDSTSWARAKEYEKIIIKTSFDAFMNTELNEYLNKIGANKIIVCGLLTSVCVLFTAQSAFARGYEVFLYEPGCADRDKNNHAAIIKIYDGYIFKRIQSTQLPA
tara:strand:- start:1259 stop:1777 length:519 start_codon:yes stop_codon:yes gene_type:complete